MIILERAMQHGRLLREAVVVPLGHFPVPPSAGTIERCKRLRMLLAARRNLFPHYSWSALTYCSRLHR